MSWNEKDQKSLKRACMHCDRNLNLPVTVGTRSLTRSADKIKREADRYTTKRAQICKWLRQQWSLPCLLRYGWCFCGRVEGGCATEEVPCCLNQIPNVILFIPLWILSLFGGHLWMHNECHDVMLVHETKKCCARTKDGSLIDDG